MWLIWFLLQRQTGLVSIAKAGRICGQIFRSAGTSVCHSISSSVIAFNWWTRSCSRIHQWSWMHVPTITGFIKKCVDQCTYKQYLPHFPLDQTAESIGPLCLLSPQRTGSLLVRHSTLPLLQAYLFKGLFHLWSCQVTNCSKRSFVLISCYESQHTVCFCNCLLYCVLLTWTHWFLWTQSF